MADFNFSGIASGIDTNALIQATSDATRAARSKPLQTQVAELTDTNTAFGDLKTKLKDLQSLLLPFTTLNGGIVQKQASSTDETKLTAIAANTASNGSYTITVGQLAKNHTHSYDDRFASPSEELVPAINDGDPAVDRTVSYVIGNGTDQKTISVVLDSNTTVDSFVSAFNSASTNNGTATASAVNVGTAAVPSYAIIINTNNPGTQKGEIVSVTVGASVTGQARFSGTFSEDPALDAEFTVSGIAGTITRSTNQVSDVIPGLTLNLVSNGLASISVSEDPTATTTKVQEFVDAYNELIVFLSENNQVRREENDEDVTNVFSPLSKTRTDDNALTALRNAISTSTYSGGSAVRIIADLGITTQVDGSLKFDSDKFKTALASEATSVNSILQRFGDTVAVTGGVLYQYVAPNLLIDLAVKGNTTLITNLNDQIASVEKSIAQTEANMRTRFASFEARMGRLQSQQSALTSALAGIR